MSPISLQKGLSLFPLVDRARVAIKYSSLSANDVNDPDPSSSPEPQSAAGFRISDEPIVRAPGALIDRTHSGAPVSHDADLLYLVARDPKSLFVYWDLNWTRAFAAAGLSPRQVQLRIYRQDGTVEATREINPFLGHCYAEVAAAGTGYFCELGCFYDQEWTSLVRSGRAVTPQDRFSEDVSAQFATLPLHLSFQRMLDVLRPTQEEGATLAQSVAGLQEKARRAGENGQSRNGANGAPAASDLAALRETPDLPAPTPGERTQWMKLAEELGGSSWGGASESGLGGSSPA